MTATRGGGWVSVGRHLGARYSVCWRSLLRRALLGLLSLALDNSRDVRLRSCSGPAPCPCVVLLRVEGPSFTGSFPPPFSFSAARSPQLPPFVTPALLRPPQTASMRLPSTCHDRLPERSEFAGIREGAGTPVMEKPESVGGLRDEGAVDVA